MDIGGTHQKKAEGLLLVIEDDPATLALNSRLLEQAGFSVDVAADGEAGWRLLTTRTYDLLVTDNEMPRLSGLCLVERMRASGVWIPVIIASGSLVMPDDYPNLGLTAILHKPYHFREIVQTVRRILE